MTQTRTAFIAIVGCPNVGKSSILNRLLGQKVAVVSPKPQTTRTKIMGVLTEDEVQLVFTDTPGFHRPRTKLGEKMIKAVSDSISGVDACLFVVEPSGELRDAEKDLLKKFKDEKMPVILAINKIDSVKQKELLIERMAQFSALYDFEAIVPCSALKGDGFGDLKDELFKQAQPSPHFFPDDTLTDQPERVLAAEIIREKLLNLLDDEVPHGLEYNRYRRHDLLRAREPQGHNNRQKRRDAQKSLDKGARGYGALLHVQNQPPLLGKGQRGLAQQRGTHPQFRARQRIKFFLS